MADRERDDPANLPYVNPKLIYGPVLYFFVVPDRGNSGRKDGDREPNTERDWDGGYGDLGSSDLGGSLGNVA